MPSSKGGRLSFSKLLPGGDLLEPLHKAEQSGSFPLQAVPTRAGKPAPLSVQRFLFWES